jgi:hypothetical protein
MRSESRPPAAQQGIAPVVRTDMLGSAESYPGSGLRRSFSLVLASSNAIRFAARW